MTLQTDVGKEVGIIFRPFHEVVTQSEVSYEWRMTGEVLTYQARQRLQVQFTDFGAYLAAGLLAVRRQTQHRVEMSKGGGD